MRNLFELDSLSIDEINDILNRAIEFSEGATSICCKDKIIASMFFEPSTRTQQSFHVALMKLGAKVLSFDTGTSSLQKGESFYDTVKCFEVLGCDGAIIRHGDNRYYNQLEEITMPIMSGGDGTGNHPSQSLLDLLTIKQEFGAFEGLKICVVGDILHSRVAHTNLKIMKRLGMETFVSGPREFIEEDYTYIDFEDALKEMDIIMLLRIQHERLSQKVSLTSKEYNLQYGLSTKRVSLMKDRAIIMHPAPFNRGVEIDDDCVECDKSRIYKQMENGVFTRMSIVEFCLKE